MNQEYLRILWSTVLRGSGVGSAIRIAAGLPLLSFDQMYYLLTATAIDIGPSGFNVYSGYGLVDAYYVVYNALRI